MTDLKPLDAAKVGQAETYQNPTEAYDAKHGTFHNPIPTMPTEAKLPTQQMPMAPVAVPFVIKGGGTGER